MLSSKRMFRFLLGVLCHGLGRYFKMRTVNTPSPVKHVPKLTIALPRMTPHPADLLETRDLRGT